MGVIKEFGQLASMLSESGVKKKVAVVWACDSTTRQAMARALAAGFAEAVFIGCRQEVVGDPALAAHQGQYDIIDVADADAAAAKAVELVREGQADVIMKGMINTDNLLRALLNKQTGILPAGAVLSHVTVAEIPAYDKLLIFTDAAVIPYPTDEQRHAQVEYALALARKMGHACPRVALIHCSEKVDERHFPFTADYVRLREMCANGQLGDCVVDGPLDVKTACSLAAMEKKGIHSPIAGQADALVFPDIEAANAFYKTITLFAGASTAGILVGLHVPVVLPSRGDSVESKFCSLALAAL